MAHCIPFIGKPTEAEWLCYANEVAAFIKAHPNDEWVVIIDPIANISPVKNENDNAEMLNAIKPFRAVSEAGGTVLAVHHGDERPRGASSLEGFVDQILSLQQGLLDERTRVLKIRGRYSQSPSCLVFRLDEAGKFVSIDSTTPSSASQPRPNIDIAIEILRTTPDLTPDEILNQWPEEGEPPSRTSLVRTLSTSTLVINTGGKVKGNPSRWRLKNA